MPADITPYLTVTAPNAGVLSGAWAYDAGTFTHTFTPTAPYGSGTYTIDITGADDSIGEPQIVPTTFSFSTPTPGNNNNNGGGNNNNNNKGGGNNNNRPMLTIRFDKNNNFVSRGSGRNIEVIFENMSGQPIQGTLELVFPTGLTPSNATSTHGTPTLTQLVQSVMAYAKRMSHAQATPASTNDLSLNFGQVGAGESVVLGTVVTVSPTYTASSATIQARLVVNGQVVDTATALLVVDNNVSALPATGETPLWRDLLIISLLGLSGLGVAIGITRRRINAKAS
jgi:hypothetical protein